MIKRVRFCLDHKNDWESIRRCTLHTCKWLVLRLWLTGEWGSSTFCRIRGFWSALSPSPKDLRFRITIESEFKFATSSLFMARSAQISFSQLEAVSWSSSEFGMVTPSGCALLLLSPFYYPFTIIVFAFTILVYH